MTWRPLPTDSPAAQGVDARGISAFLDAADAARGIELHGLMVLRHGHVVAQGWWAPYTADRVHLLYSVSKSFTSTAAGFAVAEGLVRLDDPVIAYFPELDDEITEPATRSMLVRHVASMASGHRQEMLEQAHAEDPADLVRGFLRLPPDQAPGTVFAYNQPATYTLAAIVQRVSGQRLTDYLRPRLFDPLGIGQVAWDQFPPGQDVGFSGLHATTDAVAKLGQLYLQHGSWEGRQLLPPEWVTEATRPQISTAGETNRDWALGYGFQFWASRHGYRADGAYGQFALVLPEHDAVVAITSATNQTQPLLDAVWEHPLPAFGDAGPVGEADAALRDRLGRLALQPQPAGEARDVPERAWADGTFLPEGGRCREQPSLTGVQVRRTGDEWTVALVEGDDSLVARMRAGDWVVSEPVAPGGGTVPVAVSGGWPRVGVLRADVAFLETPHRLAVTCRLAEGTFEAHWLTAPLRTSRLSTLRSPKPG